MICYRYWFCIIRFVSLLSVDNYVFLWPILGTIVTIVISDVTCPFGNEAATVDPSLFGNPETNNKVAELTKLKLALLQKQTSGVELNVNDNNDGNKKIVVSLPVDKNNAGLLSLMAVS